MKKVTLNLKLLFLVLMLSSTTLIVACSNYGERLTFNKSELFFTQAVTKSEAQKLGDFLVERGVFNGNPLSVQLDRRDETYLIRFIVKKGAEQTQVSEDVFSIVAMTASALVFDLAKVEVHMCDQSFNTLKVVAAK